MAKGDLKEGAKIGRYVIEEVVGQGGMSTVYRARHETTRKTCALKVLKHRLDEQRQKLWLQEAQVEEIVGRSPHLVQVLDADIDDASGLGFLAMELLEGETLAERVESKKNFTREEALECLRQLSVLLAQAHHKGVIHRDLKPHNLFLTHRDDGTLLLKVLDFGAARVQQGGQQTATHLGTEFYASPEQRGSVVRKLAEARGLTISRDVSPASDVWAYGLVAYELLTSYEPGHLWGDRDSNELILEGIPRPSEAAGSRRERLPPGFDDWFAACVQLDAARRYPGVRPAFEELARLCVTSPDVARRLSPVETRLGIDTMQLEAPVASASERSAARAPHQEAASAPKSPEKGASTELGSVQTFIGAPESQKKFSAKPSRRGLFLALGGAAVLTLAGVVLSRSKPDAATPSAKAPSVITAEASAAPSAAERQRGDEKEKREALIGQMLALPAGVLVRGGRMGRFEADELPSAEVPMRAMLLDRTEVTVAAWKLCVSEGRCPQKKGVQSVEFSADEATRWSRYCTEDLVGYEQHPINCVDALQAEAFCSWAGKRLPTEEEWEYAARGVTTAAEAASHVFPWGAGGEVLVRRLKLLNACDVDCIKRMKADGFKGFDKAMFDGSDGFETTAPVASFEANAFGLCDMAGNVSEWTASWYSPTYGGTPDKTRRVNRGSNWEHADVQNVRAARRFKDASDTRDVIIGFRCARDLLGERQRCSSSTEDKVQ